MPAVQKAKSTTPSFETVWLALQEERILMKELRESQKETARQIEETSRQMKETDRKMQKTDEYIKLFTDQFGDLSNKFGTMTEHLVAPGIVDKFNSLGYHFDGVADRGFKIYSENGKQKTEIDILLENGDYIIAVEVKADVRKKDIDHHIKRLEVLREYRNKKNDKRKIRGAIAGAVFYSNIKELAIAKGFYVLEQSGDTMKMDIPKGFKPKEW